MSLGAFVIGAGVVACDDGDPDELARVRELSRLRIMVELEDDRHIVAAVTLP